MTATRAPSQTPAVFSTEPTPVATLQPIRHACSGGSPSAIGIAAAEWTTVRVANVPICNVCESVRAVREMQAVPHSWRSTAAADVTTRAPAAGTARRAPPEHDAISRRKRRDAAADLLNDACSFMAQQHRETVRPAGLDDMKIAMADPTRLDSDEHFAFAGSVDLDLFEVEAPDLAQDDAAIHA